MMLPVQTAACPAEAAPHTAHCQLPPAGGASPADQPQKGPAPPPPGGGPGGGGGDGGPPSGPSGGGDPVPPPPGLPTRDPDDKKKKRNIMFNSKNVSQKLIT